MKPKPILFTLLCLAILAALGVLTVATNLGRRFHTPAVTRIG
jgi:hypothetical protein